MKVVEVVFDSDKKILTADWQAEIDIAMGGVRGIYTDSSKENGLRSMVEGG